MKEMTLHDHAASNFAIAIDQAHEYTDPHFTAFDAYSQNTYESALEDGYSVDDAMRARDEFWGLVRAAGHEA